MIFTVQAKGESQVSCTFEKGKWNSKHWILVRRPDWEHFGNWIQRDGYIENETPADATAVQMQSGKMAAMSHASMVYKKKMALKTTIESTMEFDFRMAPAIIIASQLGKDKQNRTEYREHFEVVFYDEGVNVWHHTFTNGKSSWTKAAWFRFSLKPKQKYRMKIELRKSSSGKTMTIYIDGKQVGGYAEKMLPDTFYVGITGCEGINRFYDFTVTCLGKMNN